MVIHVAWLCWYTWHRSELEGGVSERHLQCGYMDWDEIRSVVNMNHVNVSRYHDCVCRSTIRVTRKKLGLPL